MSTGEPRPDPHSTDEDLVGRLVAGQFPRWAGMTVEWFPSGGTVNSMYRLGAGMAVRLPLRSGGVEDVRRERRWLPRLAPELPTAVPEVLGVGEPAEGYPWPWSVYRWRAGVNPEAGALSESVPLARDLAEFVAAMWRVSLPGAPEAHRGGPLSSLDAETRAAIDELRVIPAEGVNCDAALAIWEHALRAPDWSGPPVWLHADLMPGNLLVDEGGRLTSVIDFGCTGVGDPACDLFPAWNLLPADARRAFRVALDVDEATWARGRARTLSQALVALPHYRNSNPSMAHNARHVIRTVLGEVA